MITINEAKSISAKIKYHAREKFLDEQRAEYAEYTGESRACGYEVVSFQEYIGERDLKAEFSEFYASLSPEALANY